MEVFRGQARRAPHRSFWLRGSLLGSAFLSSFGLTIAEPSFAEDTSSSTSAPAATAPAHPKVAHHAAPPPHNAAAPAQGTAASAQVADVVVVARDRKEKAQSVPLPISTVSGETAQREHDERIQDFSQKVPNFVVLAENPRVSALAIRGVGGDASNDGSESAVGVIVDGVFLTHVGFVWLDLVDLDSVEVVRGPQGTLLGKNTTVGAVIITTQLPSFVRQTSVEATFGNYGHVQTKINTTGPINDQLAYRVTFYGDKSQGFAQNEYNGEGLLDNNRWGIRAQLLYQPTVQFSDRLILEHYSAQETNNWNPAIADPTTYTSGLPRDGWQGHLAAIGYTPTYNIWGNGDLDTLGPVDQRTEGVSNTINWQIGTHTLTAITAWRQFHFVPHNDSDWTPLPIDGSGYDVDANQYSQEIRLASPANQKLEYQVGFYGLREQVWSTDVTQFYQDAAEFFAGNPLAPSAYLNGTQYSAAGTAFTTSLAGFGQATYHVTDKFALTAGIRDTQEYKTGSDTSTFTGTANPLSNELVPSLGGIGFVGGSQATNSVSWLFNPSYKVNDHILTYFSVAQGEKSGAINTGAHAATATSPAIPLFIQPEQSTDFELGAKTNWFNGRVIFNANLYWDNISNFQADAVTTTGSTVSAYLTNVGLVRMRGVELEGRASPIDDLWITYSGAFNDARYVSYPNAPPPAEMAYSATANPTGVTSVNLSGYQLVGAPRWNAQLGLYYEHPIGPGFGKNWTGFSWLSESWRSTVSLNNPLSAYGWQPAYALTNIGIGVHSTDDILSVQIWSRNLFNQQYLIAVAPATTLTPYAAYLGDPRTFGATVRTVF